MPALFAYLIAVGLLLGGGYGALSWLAAPEPVKVAAKAKPKPPSAPHEAVSSKPTASEPAASPEAAARAQGAQPGASKPMQDTRFDHAAATGEEATPRVEASPVEARQEEVKQEEDKQPDRAASAVSQNNAQASVLAAPPAVAKPAKRQHQRQASHHSQKRALALMTLRTIEFPDGRRVTQLVPYRDDGRAMAFDLDE